MLYVLHTTRTAAELGRYESPELTSADVESFLSEFGRFLSQDSRHDLSVRSHDDDATIVFDRHNLIFAYGPLELFERELQLSGAREGEPAVLGAHMHHYHPDWDDAERESCVASNGGSRRFDPRTCSSIRSATETSDAAATCGRAGIIGG